MRSGYELDPDERGDDAPDAVDEQVAAQQRGGHSGRLVLHTAESQRHGGRDDQRALKMIAEMIAEEGVPRFITFGRPAARWTPHAGDRSRRRSPGGSRSTWPVIGDREGGQHPAGGEGSCLPTSTISISESGSRSRSTYSRPPVRPGCRCSSLHADGRPARARARRWCRRRSSPPETALGLLAADQLELCALASPRRGSRPRRPPRRSSPRSGGCRR